MVALERHRDPRADDPRGADGQGGLLTARDPAADPDTLLAALREAAGEPPLTPLALPEATSSDRPGPIGVAVGTARRAVLRLIAPSLADLLAQLERDRHRQRGEIERLAARVAELEGRAGPRA